MEKVEVVQSSDFARRIVEVCTPQAVAAARAAVTAGRLSAFLREAAAKSCVFGEWDCAMTLANWVRARTGIDPAHELRGRYRTKIGWMRIVKRAGGLLPLVERLALTVGMHRVDTPVAGAVGVVETALGPVGAIRTAKGWAMKVGDGIAIGPARALAAWDF